MSENLPDRPGWYWITRDGGRYVEAVEIYDACGGGLYARSYYLTPTPVEDVQGKWLSRLENPQIDITSRLIRASSGDTTVLDDAIKEMRALGGNRPSNESPKSDAPVYGAYKGDLSRQHHVRGTCKFHYRQQGQFGRDFYLHEPNGQCEDWRPEESQPTLESLSDDPKDRGVYVVTGYEEMAGIAAPQQPPDVRRGEFAAGQRVEVVGCVSDDLNGKQGKIDEYDPARWNYINVTLDDGRGFVFHRSQIKPLKGGDADDRESARRRPAIQVSAGGGASCQDKDTPARSQPTESEIEAEAYLTGAVSDVEWSEHDTTLLLKLHRLNKCFEEAKAEAATLRNAIREHRAQRSDDRCWMDDQKLYAVLGDGDIGDNRVGSKAAMLVNCERYIERRCSGGGWATYAQLEELIKAYRELAALTIEPYDGPRFEQRIAARTKIEKLEAELAKLKESS